MTDRSAPVANPAASPAGSGSLEPDGPKWRFLAPALDRSRSTGRRPTFSVVIPAYQAAPTIAEAVESALAQSVPPKEVIVCDDGSTDGTQQALERYGGEIALLRTGHGGAAAARNLGIGHASGDFVAFLDADDVFLSERLEALGALAAARPDLDILATDMLFEVEGKVVGSFFEHNDFELEDQRLAIFRDCFVTSVPAVRRSRLLEVGGFDESLPQAEDWELWLRLILAGARAGLVREPLLRYRLHRGSLTSDRLTALRGRLRLLEKHLDRDDLSADERREVEQLLVRRRERVALAEAEAALAGLRPRPSRELLRVVVSRRSGLKARIDAAGALLVPSAIGRRIAARRRAEGRSRLERPIDKWLN